MPGGNGLSESTLLAVKLQEHGVSMLNVTGGWHEAPVPQLAAVVPRGGYAFLAAAVKKKVDIPVVASNRINAPEVAEKILQLGQADLITVARGHLADPEWVNKAQSGRSDNIRKCIGCMTCMDELFEHGQLVCAVNPDCGQEHCSRLTGPGLAHSVLVVGAGPAGMEASCRLSQLGYAVTLADSQDKIGGQWNLAAVPPGKAEFTSLLDYYQNELQRLKVNLVLNCRISTDNLDQFPADRIIIATGARPFKPDIPVSGDTEVLHAWEVLNGRMPKGPDVVVVGGGSTGCETALYLAELGTLDPLTLHFLMLYNAETVDNLRALVTKGAYRVKIVDVQSRLASDMGLASRWPLMTHMKTLGIEAYPGHRVREIRENAVVTEDQSSFEHWLPATSVVIALGSRPEDSLYLQLRNQVTHVCLLGDAAGPGRLKDAIHGACELVNEAF